MNHIKQRCDELGLNLPPISPRGLYSPVVRHGDTLYVSGQVSRVGNGVIAGPVDDLPESEREAAGRAAALRALSALADAIGPQEQVRILKLNVFILSNLAFQNHSQVADAVSRQLLEVLGDAGSHGRTAVGVASLPSGGAIEIELVCTTRTADA